MAERHEPLMVTSERAIVFKCQGDRLIGIVAEPSTPVSDVGVVIIVGGPQYRAGSHRQFVHLSRHLASEGWPVLRFDYRGMGDAEGSPRSFEQIDDDIRAAVDAIVHACPTVRRVILWGLCDGASAALLYAATDDRIGGLALANPWVRDTRTEAVTQVKHYYGGRLLSGGFWRKLLGGGVDVGSATRELLAAMSKALARDDGVDAAAPTFQARMLESWKTHGGPVLLLMSGNDLTAKEFLDYTLRDPAWRKCLEGPESLRCDLAEADHTFSSLVSKNNAAIDTARWVQENFESPLFSGK
jgi:exosortase A-associated hydrolase 1